MKKVQRKRSSELGICSSEQRHIFTCERPIGGQVKDPGRRRGGCVREREEERGKEGKLKFQITCARGAAWVGMCWSERGSV